MSKCYINTEIIVVHKKDDQEDKYVCWHKFDLTQINKWSAFEW